MLNISDLPDEILFLVFSFLSGTERIVASKVCKQWYKIADDKVVWHYKLLNDLQLWNITFMTESEVLERISDVIKQCELKITVCDYIHSKSKCLYVACNPWCNQCRRWQAVRKKQSIPFFFNLSTSWLRWSSKEKTQVPTIVMCGPGLETPGISVIARRILSGQGPFFTATGMSSSKGRGMGSGVTVNYQGEPVCFVFLYSNTKMLRESLSPKERNECNKLLVKDNDGMWQLATAAAQSCEDTSALIYVIDATQQNFDDDDPYLDLPLFVKSCTQKTTELKISCENVKAVSSKRHDGASQMDLDIAFEAKESPYPLLVLACVPDWNVCTQNWSTLLSKLNLWRFNIPWQVCLVDVATLSTISTGMDWLLAHTRGHNCLVCET